MTGEVIVRSGEGRFGTLVEAGNHRWRMDEPVEAGGADTGPTPYDMLLAGLGACTSMTLNLYARREGIPLEGVTIRLHHDRNHAKDCAHCADAGENPRIEAIFRTITLEGPLSFEQRERLMAVAEKCPVHRTLTGTLHVHTAAG